MKRATYIIGLLFWVASVFTVNAQEQKPSNITPLPILIECGPVQEIESAPLNSNEVPVAEASVSWMIPSGQFITAPLVIWANPSTRSMSMILHVTPEMACLAFPGIEFGPVKPKGNNL